MQQKIIASLVLLVIISKFLGPSHDRSLTAKNKEVPSFVSKIKNYATTDNGGSQDFYDEYYSGNTTTHEVRGMSFSSLSGKVISFLYKERNKPVERVKVKTEGEVVVSHYGNGDGFNGKKTANGERLDTYGDLTVAHKKLPYGTIVRFRNPENGKTVVARVNDRGPYVQGRTFDLSFRTAKALGVVHKGTATVHYEIVAIGRSHVGVSDVRIAG